jgi:predicted nucleotide-binding protein
MSEEEEWMRAEDALAYLGVPHFAAADTICTRAYNGMIKARAKRYISPTGRASDDVEVPREFWRERGDITANWRAGDFETTALDAQMSRVQAFGVMFRRSDIEQIRPASTAASTGGTPSSSTQTPAEWMSAAEALAFLDGRARSICQHAKAGLVKARAKLFIAGGRRDSDCEIPPDFWWAEGEEALEQDWATGHFKTTPPRDRLGVGIYLEAFGVQFRRLEIEQLKPHQATAVKARATSPSQEPAKQKIFIGHGHSSEWLKLKDFLKDRLRLNVVDFESVSPAGVATTERLSEMLEAAGFAFLVLTGEDEQATGKLNARLNVIHEAGLFQGKLGFRKAILLKEDGCEDFSNVHGLGEIRFPKGNVGAQFEEVRRVLEREGMKREGVEIGSD